MCCGWPSRHRQAGEVPNSRTQTDAALTASPEGTHRCRIAGCAAVLSNHRSRTKLVRQASSQHARPADSERVTYSPAGDAECEPEPDVLATATIATGFTLSRPESAGRMWVSAPALLPRFRGDVAVGSGPGPGLTSESADAARAVLGSICRPGPTLKNRPGALPDAACPALARRVEGAAVYQQRRPGALSRYAC